MGHAKFTGKLAEVQMLEFFFRGSRERQAIGKTPLFSLLFKAINREFYIFNSELGAYQPNTDFE